MKHSDIKPVLIGLIIGAVVTIPALFIAFLSAGIGHGDYVFTRILFPIPMLTTIIENGSIGPISFTLAFLQYPIYGALLGYAHCRGSGLIRNLLLVMHVIAAGFCFTGILPSFS